MGDLVALWFTHVASHWGKWGTLPYFSTNSSGWTILEWGIMGYPIFRQTPIQIWLWVRLEGPGDRRF